MEMPPRPAAPAAGCKERAKESIDWTLVRWWFSGLVYWSSEVKREKLQLRKYYEYVNSSIII